MQNIALHIAYDGTDFSGYQEQDDQRTVAGVLRDAVEDLTGRSTRLIAAGRTDAGVHAEDQVVNFLTSLSLPSVAFAAQLTRRLPEDVRILRVQRMASTFHARFQPHLTTYRYQLWNGGDPPPTFRRTWYPYSFFLDRKKMREAAQLFVGTHDFSAFCISEPYRSPIRRIQSVRLEAGDDRLLRFDATPLLFTFIGPSFLHQQVRRMVGALLAIGRGKMTPGELKTLLEKGGSTPDIFAVPAKGLTLQEICYIE